MATIIQSVFYGETTNRVRAAWRILVPVVISFLALAVSGGVAVSMGANRAEMMLVSFTFTAIVVFGLAYASSNVLDKRPLREYGYNISRSWSLDYIAGTLIGLATMGLAFLIARANGAAEVVNIQSPTNPQTALWLVAFFLAFVLVGFYEEWIYRGVFIVNAVEGLAARGYSHPVTIAFIASTAGFTITHIPSAVAGGANILLVSAKVASLGAILGVAYLLTDELALPMGLHLGVNYGLMNVFGIGSAGIPEITSIVVVEHTASGLWDPAQGIPIIAATVGGLILITGWVYWSRGCIALQQTSTVQNKITNRQ